MANSNSSLFLFVSLLLFRVLHFSSKLQSLSSSFCIKSNRLNSQITCEFVSVFNFWKQLNLDMRSKNSFVWHLICLIFLFFNSSAGSQSFIGVNYGQVADNLPPPAATAKLLQSTSIQKLRLYGADPAIIKALANTGVGIVIGASSGDIPALASDPNAATQWINSNVLPFYPASKIILITVGNEVN